jgi:hypothetical protein
VNGLQRLPRGPRPATTIRDWWDKASIISGFVSSVVIALIGILISYSIQRAQLISAEKNSEAQIAIARLTAEDDKRLQEGQLTAQLVQHLVGKDPAQREIAIVALRNSVPADVCEKITAILARQDADSNVRAQAITQLGQASSAVVTRTLAAIAHDQSRPAAERALAAESSLKVAARQAATPTSPVEATFLLASTAANGIALDRSPFTTSIIRGMQGDADTNQDGVVAGTELGQYVFRRMVVSGGRLQSETQQPVWTTRGPGDIAVGPLASLKSRYRRVLAIVVGSTSNPTMPRLRGTLNDVVAFASALNDSGLDSSITTTLLKDRGATKAAVVSAFANAARQGKPDDLFIFYFGGYAAPSPDGNVKWFLADGPTEALTVADINGLLDRIPARHKAVFVDSCNAGALAR